MLPFIGTALTGLSLARGAYGLGKSLFGGRGSAGGGGKQNAGTGGGDYRSRLTDMLFADLGRAGGPMADAGYQAGVGELQRLTGRQAEADAARVASSGLRGGEMEVALAGGRTDALLSALNELLGRSQERAERGQLSRMALAFRDAAQREALEEQARQRRTGAVMGGLSTLVNAASLIPGLGGRDRS